MMRCVALVGIARTLVGGSVALGWVHSKHHWCGVAGSVSRGGPGVLLVGIRCILLIKDTPPRGNILSYSW
jgi:hypothetical protein